MEKWLEQITISPCIRFFERWQRIFLFGVPFCQLVSTLQMEAKLRISSQNPILIGCLTPFSIETDQNYHPLTRDIPFGMSHVSFVRRFGSSKTCDLW